MWPGAVEPAPYISKNWFYVVRLLVIVVPYGSVVGSSTVSEMKGDIIYN